MNFGITRQQVKRLGLRLLALIVVGYLAACAYLYVQQRHYLYLTGESQHLTPVGADFPYQKISYPTADQLTLWGYYRPPPTPDAPVLLVFHGNTGIGPILETHAAPLAALPYGILLATYRGYEGNSGVPTEAGLRADAEAALAYLAAGQIAPGRIVVLGHSLGSGVATDLAWQMAQRGMPAAGLVLEAPFTSMIAMAQRRYGYIPVDWLLQDRFDNLSKITAIGCPLLVMHGGHDLTVPQSMGRALENAAQPATGLWLPDADHQSIFSDAQALAALKEFTDRLKRPSVSAP